MSREIERNQDATCYVGNLDDRVTDELMWELMYQAGHVVHVNMPKDRVSQLHQGFAFAEFHTETDAQYACLILNGIKLFGKPIRVNMAASDTKEPMDIGANLFIGNLDSSVDERTLYDTFNTFGTILGTPKVRFIAHPDHARPCDGRIKELWIRVVRLVRGVRRCD